MQSVAIAPDPNSPPPNTAEFSLKEQLVRVGEEEEEKL
jgi:hypothetical protein